MVWFSVLHTSHEHYIVKLIIVQAEQLTFMISLIPSFGLPTQLGHVFLHSILYLGNTEVRTHHSTKIILPLFYLSLSHMMCTCPVLVCTLVDRQIPLSSLGRSQTVQDKPLGVSPKGHQNYMKHNLFHSAPLLH